MEGVTVAILAIVLFSGVFATRRTRRGRIAVECVTADFPLAPERAAEIVAVAGLTLRETMARKSVPVVETAEGLRCEFSCPAGVMVFEIRGVEGAAGSRVTGWAREIAAIPLPDMIGLGITPAGVVDMPINPAKLLRRRDRVLRALAAAPERDGVREAVRAEGNVRRPVRASAG
ncbi:hypothetical protein [Sphaerisporangium fuscum]|uniref:hypothetical protein n=1 Tax=Sphaerisporangium fuscum TaxID=2835868 RepID=UPI001BDD4D5C|nr:hypothetical protein [Sphaerisporangium fuscum]